MIFHHPEGPPSMHTHHDHLQFISFHPHQIGFSWAIKGGSRMAAKPITISNPSVDNWRDMKNIYGSYMAYGLS